MGILSKQVAIYISLFTCCMPYTMIATFYPQIASSKGLAPWLIGAVFSADPVFGLIASALLGKYMISIGRKASILLSFFLISLSIAVLSPIKHLTKVPLILISFASRMLAGFGSGCAMTAADSILISDYPEEVEKMIGRIEGAIGLGLIVGPLIGILLDIENLMYSLISLSVFVLLLTPLCSRMLGTFREYKVENDELKQFSLALKVKIFLDLNMNIALLFSFGFIIPTLALHLDAFGASTLMISLAFMLLTFVYTFFCFAGASLFKWFDERTVLVTGMTALGMGYLILSPWEVLFPRSIYSIIGALPIIGLGQAMIYRTFYIVPTYPHMLKSAVEDYGFNNDDLLSDAVSSLSNMSCDIGEIIGPIISGALIGMIGFENTGILIAFCSFGFAGVYFVGSGLMSKFMRRAKNHGMLSMKIIPSDDKIIEQ